jgi:hypothetical protein
MPRSRAKPKSSGGNVSLSFIAFQAANVSDKFYLYVPDYNFDKTTFFIRMFLKEKYMIEM